jgi:lycopene cyclase domain-containing protein
MSLLYLAALLFSLCGMIILDKKYSLAFFHDKKRTLITIGIAVAVFIAWDIAGIMLGIFFAGDSPYMSGLFIAPDFPVEELVFLTFLSYFTLIVYRILEKRR